MKISIPAKELKHALTGLTKVSPRKASLPVLRGMRIVASLESVRFDVTDLDSHLSYTGTDAVASEPGTLVLAEVGRLKQLIARLKEDMVLIESRDGHTATVILQGPLGEREQSFSCHSVEDWPEDPPPVKVQASEVPFTELFNALIPFSSKDPSREVLNGLCIDQEGSATTLVATDGRRLTAVNSISLPVKKTTIIPNGTFLCWTKLAAPFHIGATEDWFRLVSGNLCYTCRTREGTFPNWRQVVPDEQGENGLCIAEEDLPVLEEALRTLPGGIENASVCLKTVNSTATISACDPETDTWVDRELPNSTQRGCCTTIDRGYLRDAVHAGFYDFHWKDDLSPLLARTEKGLHVLMPMRSHSPSSKTHPTTEPNKENVVIQNPQQDEKPQADNTEQLWTAYQDVRERQRDLNAALSALGEHLKFAKKQDKAVRSELQHARGVLEKLQSISL